MPAEPQTDPTARFAPHAHRELAGMFDGVSPRYDLLNRLMSLGQDGVWRRSMWRCVPENATVVLDLCTGNGASLPGLRRPGRTVLGVDVSFGMLEAATEHRTAGWGPRLVCADAFRLPLRDGAVHAITSAFGVRNLRPRTRALSELERVLRPGGVLVVLEAAAPAPGPFAPLHSLYLKRVVPLLGRLSPDPSAYLYLRDSIFEFGAGPEFERDLEASGFRVVEKRSFLFGSTRLWSARRVSGAGQIAANRPSALHPAMAEPGDEPVGASALRSMDREWRAWAVTQLVLATALTVALVYAGVVLAKSGADLPFADWQRRLAWFLIVSGVAFFGWRALHLALRAFGPSPRR
jgi:demethylmenaquinone methyltransferase/2-methoxy-6-polyprenyl-1,4-benzoquinol methylase